VRTPNVLAAIAPFVVALVAVSWATAEPVGLDSTFGTGGTVLTSLGQPLDYGDTRANAVTQQPDKKLVAAGYARDVRNNKFAVVRYNADGSVDTSFGAGGAAITQVDTSDGSDDQIRALALLSGGKLLAAGYAAFGQQDFALARYNADGTLDKTFNPDGKGDTGVPKIISPGTVLTIVGNANTARAASLVVQPDGKAVAAGFARIGQTSANFALVRYNVDGSLDSTFGTGGKVTTPIGGGKAASINALALQADGKLVAAGVASNAAGSATQFALARYNQNGTLDSTFGTGGIVLTPAGSGDADLNSLLVDGSGRLVVAGYATEGSAVRFAVARYKPDGSLDTTFNSTGMTLTPIGSDNAATAMSLVAQGDNLLAGGIASDGGVAKFTLARYTPSGALDQAFNSTGTLLTPVGDGGFAGAAGLTLAGDRVVAAGFARAASGATQLALTGFRNLPQPPPAPPSPPPSSSSVVCFQRLQVVVCPGAKLPSEPSLRIAGAPCHVGTSSVSMSRSGRIKVPLTCSAGAQGTLKLKASGRSLGSKSFSVAKGSPKTLTLKLSRAARRMLKKKRRMRAKVTITFRSGGGATSAKSSSKTITIRARGG
jgi:uncharacterized delta-60 repeat protein